MPIYQTLLEFISEKSLTDKCISLDIDNTLLYSNDDTKNMEEKKPTWVSKLNLYQNPKLLGIRNRVYITKIVDVMSAQGAGEVTYMTGILRNDAKEFMAFCFNYFRIVNFWSAGKKKYVHEMIKILCADLPHQPNLIFSWDQCDITTGDIEKPLTAMFKIPGLENLMSPKNTYSLDDRESTGIPNPDNLILIPEFAPEFTIAGLTKYDNALRQLMHWFMKLEVKNTKDIRTLKKRDMVELADLRKSEVLKSNNIFKLPLTEQIDPILFEDVTNINLDQVPLLDLNNMPIMTYLKDKNYNTDKKTTTKNSYFLYKFQNT